MADIFICYARQDTQQVVPWVGRLEALGFSVWMDVASVNGATLWAREIVEAIDNCKVLILMLTQHAAGSSHVMKEVSLASEKEKKILPLKLQDVVIPATLQYQLASIHFLELFRQDQQEAVRRVVRALSHHGVEPAAPAAAEPAATAEAAPPRPSWWQGLWPRAKTAVLAVESTVRPALVKAWRKAKSWAWDDPHKLWKRLGLGAGGLVVLGLVLCAVWLAGAGAPGRRIGGLDAPLLDNAGVRLAVQTVNARWVKKGFLKSEEKTVIGSAGVLRSEGDKLVLITNSACLDLKGMGAWPTIQAYEIWVTFATGKSAVATRFADNVGHQDLAMLEVDARDVEMGKDYRILPLRPAMEPAGGDELLVLKRSPDPNSTSTIQCFQRVVSVHSRGTGVHTCRAIYADAGLSDANRGGLLFKKHGDTFFWVGINVYGTPDTKTRNISLYAEDIVNMEPRWFPTGAEGAADALREIHGRKARVGG